MTLRRTVMFIAILGCAGLLLGQAGVPRAGSPADVAGLAARSAARFQFVDIYVDSGPEALAAWQLEFSGQIPGGSVELAGVEGGAHAAYAKPAYYDPEALAHSRVILGAFSTAKDLPKGRTRVARLHLQLTGPADAAPSFKFSLTNTANPDGAAIDATVSVSPGDSK